MSQIDCQWWVVCGRRATTTRRHSVLGDVPICETCDDKVAQLDDDVQPYSHGSECGASYSTGGHDPYGTSCDLRIGHGSSHEGPDPFGGDARLRWSGGGYCAGDPLPVHDVRWVTT